MLSSSKFPNLFATFWADLQSPTALWQLAIIGSGLLIAWLADRALRQRAEPKEGFPAVGREVMRAIRFSLVALILVLIGRAVANDLLPKATLLDLTVALLTAAIVIRLVVVMLRQVFAQSGWRDQVIRFVGVAVWIGFALHVAGVLPDLLKFLDTIGFPVGKHRVSLLLIAQALLVVLATLLVALWLGRFVETRAMAATDVDINLRVMISKLAKALLVLIAILVALPALGIDLTILSVFGGALGVGLGFGLQKIASNYISGFIILMDRSVSIGDLVTIDNHTGQLTKMTSRYVVVRNLGGIEAIIPNDTLITSTVVNQTYTDKRVSQSITVQIGYDSDLEHAMRLLEEIARRHPRVLAEPAPRTSVLRLADSGVDLELGYWFDDPGSGAAKLRSDLQLDVWREFRKHRIEIPYPQRTVHLARTAAEGAIQMKIDQ